MAKKKSVIEKIGEEYATVLKAVRLALDVLDTNYTSAPSETRAAVFVRELAANDPPILWQIEKKGGKK